MVSSKLRDRIDIYKEIKSETDFGETKTSYEFKYSCRAFVQYANGTRTVDDDEIFYAVDRNFIVRSFVPVYNTDVIHWNDQRWRILSIDRDYHYNNIVIRTTLINE